MPGIPSFVTCVVCGTGSTVSAAFLSCFSCGDHFHKEHCAGPSATLVRLGATDKFFCERCDRQRKRVKANCTICGPLLAALRKLKLKTEGDDSALKKILSDTGQRASIEDLQGFWQITGEQQSIIPLMRYIEKHFPLQGVCFLEVGEYFGESISGRASDIVLQAKKKAVSKTLAFFVRTKMQLSDEALMPTSPSNDQWRSLPLMWLVLEPSFIVTSSDSSRRHKAAAAAVDYLLLEVVRAHWGEHCNRQQAFRMVQDKLIGTVQASQMPSGRKMEVITRLKGSLPGSPEPWIDFRTVHIPHTLLATAPFCATGQGDSTVDMTINTDEGVFVLNTCIANSGSLVPIPRHVDHLRGAVALAIYRWLPPSSTATCLVCLTPLSREDPMASWKCGCNVTYCMDCIATELLEAVCSRNYDHRATGGRCAQCRAPWKDRADLKSVRVQAYSYFDKILEANNYICPLSNSDLQMAEEEQFGIGRDRAHSMFVSYANLKSLAGALRISFPSDVRLSDEGIIAARGLHLVEPVPPVSLSLFSEEEIMATAISQSLVNDAVSPNGPVEEEDFVEINLPAIDPNISNLRRRLADVFEAEVVSNPADPEPAVTVEERAGPVGEPIGHNGSSTSNNESHAQTQNATVAVGDVIPEAWFSETQMGTKSVYIDHIQYRLVTDGNKDTQRYKCCTCSRSLRLKKDGDCYKLDRKPTHAPKCTASGSEREEQNNRNRRRVHTDHALGRASASTVADIVQNHGELTSHADQRNLNATRTRLQRATKKKITLPDFRVDPKGHYKQFVLSAKEETESSDLRDEPRFLLFHDTESPMMIWAADRNMELLNKADAMIWDGTFYITPKNFEQVWVGMIAVDGWYIPTFYVLMQKRTQDEYERALIQIQRHLIRLGLLEVTQGLEFITDFEIPMRSALKKVFSLSDTQILGCLFHLCKSWIRKVQELGLQSTYWTPKPSRGVKGRWLHRLCGLPWMTIEECSTAWGALKQAKPAGEDIDKLISYIDKTYMAADALFPPEQWCRPPSDDSVTQRTSNPLEGHHRDLNSKLTAKHPGIVDFVKLLKYAQTKSRTKMNSVDYGEAPPASRCNESRRLLHYQNWKRTPGGITTFEYLEKVAELCGVRENIM